MDKVILVGCQGNPHIPPPFLFLFIQCILGDVLFNDTIHLVLLGLQTCGYESYATHSQRKRFLKGYLDN